MRVEAGGTTGAPYPGPPSSLGARLSRGNVTSGLPPCRNTSFRRAHALHTGGRGVRRGCHGSPTPSPGAVQPEHVDLWARSQGDGRRRPDFWLCVTLAGLQLGSRGTARTRGINVLCDAGAAGIAICYKRSACCLGSSLTRGARRRAPLHQGWVHHDPLTPVPTTAGHIHSSGIIMDALSTSFLAISKPKTSFSGALPLVRGLADS